ncbi:MAG: protein kinase domain-containing protein, partial [Betaproteobacteria bacterium]
PGTTLAIAVQIAGALDAAHRAGIVHRDLKPGNVMLVRGASASAPPLAKLLDFGLAKPVAPVAAGEALGAAPTRTTPITAQGAILGTFQYMAPEQLEGREADVRSDIWAFGCILSQCLTGRAPFEGASQASLIGAILKDQPPPISSSAPLVPPALDRLIATCLAKDPNDRWQSAGDLARELRWIREAPATPTAATASIRAGGRLFGVLVFAAAAALVAVGAAVGWAVHPAGAPTHAVRAQLPVVADSLVRDNPGFAVSPNGRWLVWVAADGGSVRLRDLSSGETRVLAQGLRFVQPFFSPDSLQVGFATGVTISVAGGVYGSLERVAIGGGAPVKLLDGISSSKGFWWGDDAYIYYTPAASAGLWRVRAAGGTPERLIEPDAAAGEKTYRDPFVLPGSKAVLFVVGTSRITSFDDGRIEALSLVDRTRHVLVNGGTAPRYIAALGDLVYERAGDLIAVPFDGGRLEVHGAPATIARGVSNVPANGIARYSVSDDGTFVWTPEPSVPARAWVSSVDLQGRETRLADVPPEAGAPALSPDGQRLAIDPDGATKQIAVIDLSRGATQRITYEWDNAEPLWTPDGSRLIYTSDLGGGANNLYWRPADGSGTPARLTTSREDQVPESVAGRTLLYESLNPDSLVDLWTLSLDDPTPRVLLKTPFNEADARFSPDGRWVAYESDQSGQSEVYVQAFPSTGRRWQISAGGGTRPLWVASGGIAYLHGEDVMTVSVTLAPTFNSGVPVKRFSIGAHTFLLDVTHDGRLLFKHYELPAPEPMEIISNWFDQVRQTLGRSGK